METVVTPTQSVVAAALQAAWLQTPPTLGLDISTSSTGVALLDLQGQVVYTQAVQRPKDVSLLGMAEAVGQQVRHACSLGSHNTPDIAIEECVRSFSGRHYQTRVLFSLAQLNGIVQYICWQTTGSEPSSYMPAAARAHFQLRKSGPTDKRDGIKDVVRDFVAACHPTTIDWPRTRTGSFARASYDVADAVLIAMHHMALHREQHVLDSDKHFADYVDAFIAEKRVRIATSSQELVELNALGRNNSNSDSSSKSNDATATTNAQVQRLLLRIQRKLAKDLSQASCAQAQLQR